VERRGVAVVTGAFAYTGAYVAARLLSLGVEVRTLTRRPRPDHPLARRVEARPYAFGDRRALAEALRGARVVYNTYWIRFPREGVTFADAVANTRELLAAAEEVGVERIVQFSVTNASDTSPLPYFRAKAAVESAVRSSPLTHAIVRPTLVFGREEILLNNVAWLLRRFPAFVIPGDGGYRVQPVAVEDVAELAVAAGRQSDDVTLDAAGPETYRFDDLVHALAAAVASRARIVHGPPAAALSLASAVGLAVRDVVLTRDELRGLMDGLLVSGDPPAGTRRLSDWLETNGRSLGRRYARAR
jgi:uncharacterized protein YbjT (DUF2867 family)